MAAPLTEASDVPVAASHFTVPLAATLLPHCAQPPNRATELILPKQCQVPDIK